jgi:hypothetical protein
MGESRFPAQARSANGVIRAVTSGGIGQDKKFRAIDVIEQRFFTPVSQVHAPDCHRHNFRSRGLVGARHFLEAAVLSRAHNQARVKLFICDAQDVVIHRFFSCFNSAERI